MFIHAENLKNTPHLTNIQRLFSEAIMSRDRFLLTLRIIHSSNNVGHCGNRVFKIRDVSAIWPFSEA